MTWDQTDFSTELSRDAKKLLKLGSEDFDDLLKHYELTKEEVDDMVKSLRDWVDKQPHLPGDKLDDKQIVGHLVLRGFSVEKVKCALDDFYSAKHKMPETICDRDPLSSEVAEYLNRGYWVVMPKKTPENYRLTIFRLPEYENCSVNMIFKIGSMFAEYRIWNDYMLGDRWVIDLENVGLQHTTQMTPVMISNIISFIMACLGARLKSIHIINVPPIAATLVNIFIKLLKTKLANRIFVSTKEEIQKFFPKDVLPKEYGGDCGSCSEFIDNWCKTLQSDAWRQYFIEQNDAFTDESKRLTPRPADEIYGTAGSFRKLSLD